MLLRKFNHLATAAAFNRALHFIMIVMVLCGARAGAADQLNTLAFGSCNHSHLPQPMWSVIDTHQPDLFLWTGDVVYADTTDPEKMLEKYKQQLAVPDYQDFRSRYPVIGIWDDHDYGINNGGKNNPVKRQGQQMFLDFLDEPQNTQRRQQQGIYTSYTYGSGSRQIKMYLLDTRYHRDLTGTGRADILGNAQWQWLEEEFRQSQAAINIVVSGVSVMSKQVPFAEEWNDFKWARKKLFSLIGKYQLPGVVFLTGDRHFSSHLEGKVKGRTFHEFMSSGLTHYMNRKRVSQVFKFIYGEEYSYFGRNFSKINFHWDREPMQLTYQVFDTENKKQVEKILTLRDGYWADR